MKTFSLAEVADMVLPPEWTDGVRWLARRMNRGEISGYRVGHVWRMTEQQVEAMIDRYSTTATKPVRQPNPGHPPATGAPLRVVDGLSERSRRLLSRSE
jgi:hypothetical protein